MFCNSSLNTYDFFTFFKIIESTNALFKSQGVELNCKFLQNPVRVNFKLVKIIKFNDSVTCFRFTECDNKKYLAL